MRDNYTNSLETPLTYNTEQKKLDTKKTYCVSLLRQSTVMGKTKHWGKESRQQVHLRSDDWRGHGRRLLEGDVGHWSCFISLAGATACHGVHLGNIL